MRLTPVPASQSAWSGQKSRRRWHNKRPKSAKRAEEQGEREEIRNKRKREREREKERESSWRANGGNDAKICGGSEHRRENRRNSIFEERGEMSKIVQAAH
jgi:hypothetical protein